MTPREADVAWVLEAVPGVTELYAIAPDVRGGDYDFAVRIDRAGRIAAAHYALLRVLRHEECARVVFFHTELTPSLVARSTRLVLTLAEREEARLRLPAASDAPPSATRGAVDPPPFLALVLDADDDVAASAREVFEAPARWVVTADVHDAARLAANAPRPDLILCGARYAFGPDGLLAFAPMLSDRVVVMAFPDEMEDAVDRIGASRVLAKPLDAGALREHFVRATAHRLLAAPELEQALAARATPRPSVSRVLVIDDDPGTQLLVSAGTFPPSMQVILATTEMEILERLSIETFDLVFCSAAMRTSNGTEPLYRFLFRMSAELKARLVLVVPRGSVIPPSTTGKPRPVVERPLRADVILRIVETRGS